MKSTHVSRSYSEKKFESINNNKHRTRLEAWAEDAEIEDKSTGTFDAANEKCLKVKTRRKRSKEELSSWNDEVIKLSEDFSWKDQNDRIKRGE